jgi:hypothetical protein
MACEYLQSNVGIRRACFAPTSKTHMESILMHFFHFREYWIAIINSICLLVFVFAPTVEFNRAWQASNMCMMLVLAVFVFRAQHPQSSCINAVDPSFISLEPPAKRSLPVVVVFHIIASACVGIMRLQLRIHQRNVTAIEKLKQGVVKSKKKK